MCLCLCVYVCVCVCVFVCVCVRVCICALIVLASFVLLTAESLKFESNIQTELQFTFNIYTLFLNFEKSLRDWAHEKKDVFFL